MVMKKLMVIFLFLFNLQNSLACEDHMNLVMSIQFVDGRAQYIESLRKMLHEVQLKKPDAKFLLISIAKNREGMSTSKNYVNGIIHNMTKFGIDPSNIKVKFTVDTASVKNEIKILSE
jgi:5,10-methylene-tetrahydrofolate dehydrogenase/methenyl tetrahydrofolate cyclohydrolase